MIRNYPTFDEGVKEFHRHSVTHVSQTQGCNLIHRSAWILWWKPGPGMAWVSFRKLAILKRWCRWCFEHFWIYFWILVNASQLFYSSWNPQNLCDLADSTSDQPECPQHDYSTYLKNGHANSISILSQTTRASSAFDENPLFATKSNL